MFSWKTNQQPPPTQTLRKHSDETSSGANATSTNATSAKSIHREELMIAIGPVLPIEPLGTLFFLSLGAAVVLLVFSAAYTLIWEEASLRWFEENLQERCLSQHGSVVPGLSASLRSESYGKTPAGHHHETGSKESYSSDEEENRRNDLLMASLAHRYRLRRAFTEDDFLKSASLRSVEPQTGMNRLRVAQRLPKLATIGNTLLPPKNLDSPPRAHSVPRY